MFAKLAKFEAFARRHASSATIAAQCNDNRPGRHLATASHRAPRQVLVYGWRQLPTTGRLECFWQAVSVDSSAAEEPGINWMIGRMQWSRGARLMGKPPVPAGGGVMHGGLYGRAT